MQRALAASHIDHIIAPLEKHYDVDVFLFTQSCSTEMQKKLLSWYNQGRNRTVKHVFEDARDQYDRAVTSAQELLTYFHNAEIGAADYSFFHFMRFDLVTEHGFVTDSFLNKVESTVFRSSDLAMTLPGWMIKCVLPPMSKHCDGITLEEGREPWYRCFTVNLDNINFTRYPEQTWIYRGYIGGHHFSGPLARLCNMLHDKYGGPRCSVEDAAQLVCKYVCDPHAADGGSACLDVFWQAFDEERARSVQFDDTLNASERITRCEA